MDSTSPKTPILIYYMLIKDSFMIFVIKWRSLSPINFLLSIFRQMLCSEAIKIESWKLNWEFTIIMVEKSKGFSLISFFKWVKIEKTRLGLLSTGSLESLTPYINVIMVYLKDNLSCILLHTGKLSDTINLICRTRQGVPLSRLVFSLFIKSNYTELIAPLS